VRNGAAAPFGEIGAEEAEDTARKDGSLGHERRPVAVKINTNYLCKLCRDLPHLASTVWNTKWGLRCLSGHSLHPSRSDFDMRKMASQKELID